MIVGIPKERKSGECRVAITPDSVKKLVPEIKVLIEENAGVLSGYTNEEYQNAGAQIVSQSAVWEADLILKVKEPMPNEYHLFKEKQIIWGFLHLAANPECVQVMLDKKVTAIASENIIINNEFKLLKPVSEIAGRKALFTALHYLEKQNEGMGILLSGTSVAKAGTVCILGGGVVAQNACDMALAIGANVVIIELNEKQIQNLTTKYKDRAVTIVKSTAENIFEYGKMSDVIISTVLIPGGKPPKLITEELVKAMKQGSVIIDVSSDQGGTCETLDCPTSHTDPIKIIDGVIHYAVPNMPASVPRTATNSIQGVIELIIDLNEKGTIDACPEIMSGVQVYNGKIINEKLV